MRKRKQSKRKNRSRRASLKLGVILLTVLGLWGLAGEWYAHHPRDWFAGQPKPLSSALGWIGNPLSDLTDALDWTGHDAVYEYDTEAPNGQALFAGAPVRVSAPAPSDIRILNRGHFLIGWSDKLRHPVWCAYHVRPQAPYDAGKRPGFTKDKSVAAAPTPNDFTRSGYDRGHMVPNYAIATRYGSDEQKKTFLMSNIVPQTPALNRGVWRDVEHRIADLWASRYGEIWVIVGCISDGNETVSGTSVDVPTQFYQVIVAQEGMDVRALAVLFEQDVPWNCWAARNIVTIDELEKRTGLDFNPELPGFIQDPLEADLPTRLWPIRLRDLFKLISLRFM